MTQINSVPTVDIWAKLLGFPKAIKLTFGKGRPIGPRLRAWCKRKGYTLESWETVYDD